MMSIKQKTTKKLIKWAMLIALGYAFLVGGVFFGRYLRTPDSAQNSAFDQGIVKPSRSK